MPFRYNALTNNLDLTDDGGSFPVVSGDFGTLVSPVINFKAVGVTTIATTPSNLKFSPVFAQYICESATAANGNSVLSVGWTAAAYDDYILSDGFAITTPSMAALYQTGSTAVKIFPANTDIKINVTAGDTGTAITGRIVIFGVYIN
jgi:hypothetical protein